MLNPIFWKKVQGQKHPWRWGIVEHQILSIIVLYKTNAKSHKHPGIKLLSSERKTQLVNQRKQNSYKSCIYIYIHIYINYIYINTEPLDGNKGHQEETHHPTHRFRRLFLDLLSMGWRGCARVWMIFLNVTLKAVFIHIHMIMFHIQQYISRCFEVDFCR